MRTVAFVTTDWQMATAVVAVHITCAWAALMRTRPPTADDCVGEVAPSQRAKPERGMQRMTHLTTRIIMKHIVIMLYCEML